MKRLFPLLVLAAAVGTGCQRSPAPAAGAAPTAETAKPSAAPATTPPPASGQAAAAQVPGQPPAGQPAEVPAKPVPAVLPAVVAKVNTEDIPKWELETALKQAEAKAGSQVPADKRDAVIRSILDELVTYHMLAQEARTRKVAVPEADLDAEMTTIQKSFQTEEAYKQALTERGLTVAQLRDQTRRSLEAQKLVEAEVTAKVAVQDPEVDAFYNQNIERFKQGDTIHGAHIFIAVPPGADAAAKEQGRAKAAAILKQLRAGGDFAKLAKEQSNDATAAQGGDLGFFGKGDMPPDFEAVAFGLKVGAMSDVVELGSGFHIIKVTEKRGPRTAPLTEVREQIKAFLLQGQRQAKLEQFLQQVKGKTKVQILI